MNVMKKFWLISLLPLTACQYQEVENAGENAFPALGIQAVIKDVNATRTVTYEGKTDFSESDQIGLFLPERETPYRWTYRSDGNWEPEVPLSWPDKTTVLQFAAFYPYREAVSASRIPLPDLTLQPGTWEGLGRFDFLTARTTCSYATSHQGKIPFTGESSFKHLYALLVIRFIEAQDRIEGEETVLKALSVEGKGMLAPQEYNLERQLMQPLETASENRQADRWSVSWEAGQGKIEGDGYTVPLLVNPSAQSRSLEVRVSYVFAGAPYTANLRTPEVRFESGKRYKYTVKIQKDHLFLEGSSIADWEEGMDLGEIVINARKTENKFY